MKLEKFDKIVVPVFWGILIIIALFIMFFFNSEPPPETQAITTLRLLALSEKKYQEHSDAKFFGTLDEMKAKGMIDQRFNLDNFINGYRLDWQVSSIESPDPENVELYRWFAIIAYPQNPSLKLRTFAIFEDSVVRVYSPESGDIEDEPRTWKQLRTTGHE